MSSPTETLTLFCAWLRKWPTVYGKTTEPASARINGFTRQSRERNTWHCFTASPQNAANLQWSPHKKSLAYHPLWPPSDKSPPPLPLFQCCYNDVDFSFDIFLNLQNNIGQGVWGKRKPLSNVIVWDCLKELCKICSVVLRHVNLDSLAESRQGTAGSALTLHHIK